MIPTLIVPIIQNERYDHYYGLAQERAIPSIERQTVVTPYIVSEAPTHSEAKNKGVEQAGTEACMIMDADDVLDSEFIYHIDEINEDWDIVKPRVYVNGLLNALPRYDIRKMNFLIQGCPFKRELWLDVGGAEEVPYPDWYVWAKIIIKHNPKIYYCRAAQYHYIQAPSGLNRNRTQQDMRDIHNLIAEYEGALDA